MKPFALALAVGSVVFGLGYAGASSLDVSQANTPAQGAATGSVDACTNAAAITHTYNGTLGDDATKVMSIRLTPTGTGNACSASTAKLAFANTPPAGATGAGTWTNGSGTDGHWDWSLGSGSGVLITDFDPGNITITIY